MKFKKKGLMMVKETSTYFVRKRWPDF